MSEHPYNPQPWRLTEYYPESYARFVGILNNVVVSDWDDDNQDRHEAEFRADLAARDAEVAAKAWDEGYCARHVDDVHARDVHRQSLPAGAAPIRAHRARNHTQRGTPMTTEPNEQAVEAALWAWIVSACEGVTRENVNPRVLDLNRHRAEAALCAAMPHLRRTIPNTVEALEAESVGTVIRAKSGEVYVRGSLDWWVQAGEEQLCSDDYLASPLSGITEWAVLWEGGAS